MFKKSRDIEPLNLLTGTAVQTENGYFYVKNGIRVRIPTRRVLASWRFYKVVKTTEDHVTHYPIMGKPLGFREGTLIYCIADATYYIISGGKLHRIVDPTTMKDHGFKLTDAIWVSQAERDLHERAA